MKHFLKIYFSNLRRLLMLLAVLACAGVVTDVAAGDSAVMTTTRIKYQVELKDNIESVKQSLVSALEAKNYMIINVLNVQEALQGRGIETKPVQLIEFCNLVKAYAVTRTTHEFELFAPCRLALFEENGKTIVMVLRPSFIAMTLPKETLSKEGQAALRAFDQDMRDILTALSQGDFF
jgi:uncharacterized protein (DUF302 family)